MPALDAAQQSKDKRDKRIANGKCPGCGRLYTGRFQYCKLCREKNTKRNEEYRELRHKMTEELKAIDRLLFNIPGTNRLDRIQRLVNYYLSVEAALV